MAESLYALAATVVVVLHLAFVVFAVFGALLLQRFARLVLLHLAALAWAAWISFTGAVCPLTPLENLLRGLAGRDRYAVGFIEHYLLALLYPAGLTRDMQVLLGVGVLGVNVVFYALWWRAKRRR